MVQIGGVDGPQFYTGFHTEVPEGPCHRRRARTCGRDGNPPRGGGGSSHCAPMVRRAPTVRQRSYDMSQ